jgi:hypothetical protein
MAKKVAPVEKTLGGARTAFTDEQVAHIEDKILELIPQGWTIRQVLAEPNMCSMTTCTGICFLMMRNSVSKLTLQVAEWCHYLEDFPLFAIRKAAKWAVISKDKLPSVAAFITDVKLELR